MPVQQSARTESGEPEGREMPDLRDEGAGVTPGPRPVPVSLQHTPAAESPSARGPPPLPAHNVAMQSPARVPRHMPPQMLPRSGVRSASIGPVIDGDVDGEFVLLPDSGETPRMIGRFVFYLDNPTSWPFPHIARLFCHHSEQQQQRRQQDEFLAEELGLGDSETEAGPSSPTSRRGGGRPLGLA